MKSKELSIILYSCYRNRDMWEVFSFFMKKYWPDCNYQILLATDTFEETGKEYIFDRILTYDNTWARMIKNAIKEADTPYVMLWMDDYLLCDRVKNEDLEEHLSRAKKFHAANYRLVESPKCYGIYQNFKKLGYYRRGDGYSLNTQVGIWDCAFLNTILKDEWSAWDFERIVSLSKEHNDQPVLVSLDYEFPYEEGVRQGKWMVQGAKLCKRNGIRIDESKRPIMTNKEMAKIYTKGAILDINPTLILRIQNFVNRIKLKK